MNNANVVHSYNLEGKETIKGGIGLPELKFKELLRAFAKADSDSENSRIVQINVTEDGLLFHLEN